MKIPVLDHGYVELIEPWGLGRHLNPLGDEPDYERGIIEAARQSTQGSFRGWEAASCSCGNYMLNLASPPPVGTIKCKNSCDSVRLPGDERLLKFLYSNNHSTPFEFAGLVIEVQAPIFVFREWHRHRTQSYNEMSARYEPLPELYYSPDIDKTIERGLLAGINKQAGVAHIPQSSYPSDVTEWVYELQAFYKESEVLYRAALDSGIPKELARLSMPVGHYSRMRASTNLRNWLAFLTLRCDPKAQWEIRQFAGAVAAVVQTIFPRTHKLWSTEMGSKLSPMIL